MKCDVCSLIFKGKRIVESIYVKKKSTENIYIFP